MKTNEIDIRIEKLLRSQKKTDEQLRKTDQELRESQKKTDEQLRKTDQELRDMHRKTDEQIKRLGEKIGELTDGWGKFTVGLTESSIAEGLEKLGFKIEGRSSHLLRRKNGCDYEIDLLCSARYNGKPTIIVVEAKTTINQQKIEDFTKKLQSFKDFFSEYKDRDVIGGIAGIRFAGNIKALAEKEGLYSFHVSKGLMENVNSKGFKPKVW